jgi:hypothetical protein
MHNPRAHYAADARKLIAAMIDKRVYQRARQVTRSRMHNKPARFVDDQQITVLV